MGLFGLKVVIGILVIGLLIIMVGKSIIFVIKDSKKKEAKG